MENKFVISGLDPKLFEGYFEMNSSQLGKMGIRTSLADSYPGYPCRVSLEDAQIGEEVYLISFEHHQTNSPYRSSGPVFVRKNAMPASMGINEIPEMLIHRLLSLRAYNEAGMMLDSRTLNGSELRFTLCQMFENMEIAYIHIHNAGPGCYNCKAERYLDQ